MELDEAASNTNLSVRADSDVGCDGDGDGEVENSANTLDYDISSDLDDGRSSVD